MTAPTRGASGAWTALLLLSTGFLMSQAFRTIAAIMAAPLQAELQLSPQQLGVFAAAYHFAFGGLQLFMGMGIDLHGLRRTVLTASPLMALGAAVSALATGFPMLVAGQVLIGIGSAPAFLVCTIYVARHFAPERYTVVSSLILAVGGIGMVLTGSPLAWLIEATSWRMGFWVLAGCALLSWLAIALGVHEPAPAAGARRESLGQALRTFGALCRLPHTAGIVALALVSYGAFITLRGLWLGPLLVQRFDLSLLQAGHVALAMTLGSMASPAIFGRLDPGGARRLRWLLTLATVAALLLATIGLVPLLWLDVLLAGSYGLISGFGVLQYGYVNDAYPPALRGRAMSLLTMAMFLGVSLMQWASGLAASLAPKLGVEPFSAALLTMAAMLLAGALALWKLPRAPLAQ